MVEITEAEKQALIEEGRRQARNEITQEQEQQVKDQVAELRDTRVPVEGENPPDWVQDVSLVEPMNTQKIGPDMAAVPPMSGEVLAASTPASVAEDGISEWGPYKRYEMVNTAWGEFAVPVGLILYFVPTVRWSAKSGEFIQVNQPHYRKPDEPRIQPESQQATVSVPLSAVR